jgi:hypothetical protein
MTSGVTALQRKRAADSEQASALEEADGSAREEVD